MRNNLPLAKQADITLDIDKGDTLLGGRFKNSPTVVKDIGTDELGQPTVNGKKLLAMRMKKVMPNSGAKEAADNYIKGRNDAYFIYLDEVNPGGHGERVCPSCGDTQRCRCSKHAGEIKDVLCVGCWEAKHWSGTENKEAGVDSAPNYSPASDQDTKCSKCVHAKEGYCTLYDFNVDSEYVCDSFSADFSAQTSTGVPQVMAKYLPDKLAQYVNPYIADLTVARLAKPAPKSVTELIAWLIDRHDYNSKLKAYYGAIDSMKEAQAPQPQGLQHPVTQPSGGAKAPPITGQNLNNSFKSIAQQGVRNGAAASVGVKPVAPNSMAMPYGVNSGGMPYGVNAMKPEMLQQEQQPQKAAQYQQQSQQPQNPMAGVQQRMQEYQDRLGSTRAAIQMAATNRYMQMQHEAQRNAYNQAMAAQQGQANLQNYDGGKQASYLTGFFDKCASYGVDPVFMNNLRHELLKAASYTPKQKNKVSKVMKEFKDGTLRSGNADGPKVTSRQQAIAIALSEAGVSKKS